MNISDIEKAIYKRIGEFNHQNTVVRIENQPTKDGKPFVPPQDKPWCKVYLPFNESRTIGISNKPCIRKQGIISIQCFTKKNTGTLTMSALCDAWESHLQGYQYQHLEIYLVHAPQSIDDDDFYAKIIRAEFTVH